MHEHTFFYRDQEDLLRQADALVAKLMERPKLTPYWKIRARYSHLKPAAFSMRLLRFVQRGGHFPRRMGPKGRKIEAMFVTPALDAHLRV